MSDLTFSPVTIDLVRYAHLMAVAVGLGASVLADLTVATRLASPVTKDTAARLREYHQVVKAGLIAMWVTGLVLIAIRTGLDPAQITPKLWGKIVIVTILTLNAAVLGGVVLPTLERNMGTRPIDFGWSEMLTGGCASAVSTTSWLMALALGSSAVLKTGSAGLFLLVVPAAYAIALGSAVLVVASVLAIRGMAQSEPMSEERMARLGR